MAVDRFSGEFRFLSNFFLAEVTLDGMTFPSVEHAYQAAKTLNALERARIRQAPDPGTAKRWGRNISIRPDWEAVKIDVMTNLVRQKFQNHPALRIRLLETGNKELIEGNTWGDKFWGVCNGVGQNQLGKILMQVRDSV